MEIRRVAVIHHHHNSSIMFPLLLIVNFDFRVNSLIDPPLILKYVYWIPSASVFCKKIHKDMSSLIISYGKFRKVLCWVYSGCHDKNVMTLSWHWPWSWPHDIWNYSWHKLQVSWPCHNTIKNLNISKKMHIFFNAITLRIRKLNEFARPYDARYQNLWWKL